MALSFAWKELPDGWVKSYILQNRPEVVDMLLSEYEEVKEKELLVKTTEMNTRVHDLTTLMKVDSLTLEQAMDKLKVPEADRVNIRKAFEKQ